MLKTQNLPQFPQKELEADDISVVKNQNKTTKVEAPKFLWIRAPKDMIYNAAFSDGAKLLYLILLDYQGRNAYAFPSLETLAADSGKSVRRVQQILKELEVGGAVEIVSQPGWVNLYKVCLPTENINDETQAFSKVTAKTIEATDSSDDITTINSVDSKAKLQTETEAQAIALPHNIAVLPMQNNSTELDSAKLENNVCKKPRIAASKTRKIVQPNFANTSKKINSVTDLPTTQNYAVSSQSAVFPELEDSQREIAQMLCEAGVAKADAKRIALTNPSKQSVLQWIEFAKSKANPGGYLAVVLGKHENLPPPRPANNLTAQQGKYKRCQNKGEPRSSKEAGALSYMRRHETELQSWQAIEQLVDEIQQPNEVDITKFVEPLENSTCQQLCVAKAGNSLVSSNIESYLDQSELEENLANNICGEVIDEQPDLNQAIDPQIKVAIRQLDRQASQYLKQARIEDDKLLISFIGNYYPSQSPSSWLPLLKMQYKNISKVMLL